MRTGNKKYFANKYRIPSARLSNWDYGWNASYFVTICTALRICYYGKIVNEKMQLSEIGEIVENEWVETFKIRSDMNLQMGKYVVMPNHFHAIITIGENEYNTKNGTERGMGLKTERAMGCGTDRRDAMHRVSITTKNQFGPQTKNLASIIRGFKSAVTINARKINTNFAWQSRFHDHVIRDENEYQRIQQYIINNPKKWADDKFNHSDDT
ncbi:MAG: transposase [Prolixibacteraceae bacterium]